jgi:hypothetical protein
MANTQRLEVLQTVRQAKTAVRDEGSDADLNKQQKAVLENLFVDLERLEDDLILGILDEKIESLTSTSKNLKAVAKDVKQDLDKLSGIAELVENAAKGVEMLVDVASKASKIIPV